MDPRGRYFGVRFEGQSLQFILQLQALRECVGASSCQQLEVGIETSSATVTHLCRVEGARVAPERELERAIPGVILEVLELFLVGGTNAEPVAKVEVQ
jgi:hypothetical protein